LANGLCVVIASNAAEAKALGATVFIGDGGTDAAGFDAVFQLNADDANGAHRLFCDATGLPLTHAHPDAPAGWLGVALPELEAVVLDETGRAVLPGQIGALYFTGAALPLAAAGDARFVQDPRTPYRAALMHTQLAARVNAQGEIARAGADAPVVRAVVAPAPIVVEAPRLVEASVLVAAPKVEATPVVDSQPAPSLELVHDAAPFADNSAYEEHIAAIWRDILGITAFDKTENFFFLGGTSLLLIRVQAALQTKYERKIPIEKMFENPNVSAMAAFLADDAGESAALKGVRARATRRAQALNRMRARE
jgi:acyl carrier protein